MPCETVEIAEQIGAFLARGTGPTENWPKKNWDILFCPISPKIFWLNHTAGS